MNLLWFFQAADAHEASPHEGTSRRFLGFRLVVWLAASVLLIFFLWSHWATLDQITRAPGSIISSSGTQVIQSMDGGTIDAITVKEGDAVVAGQVLVQFDRTRTEATYLEARAKMAALTAAVGRLEAEVLGGPLKFPGLLKDYPEIQRAQTQLFIKRQAAIREEIQALQGLIDLTEKELKLTEPLLKSGDVSQTDVLRLQRQVADLSAQKANRSNKYFQDAQAELSKAQDELASVQQNVAQRKSQLDLTQLRAPMNGVVKNVRTTTQGGVVRPGEEVMQIVPLEDDLVVQARVSPSDIAFLKIGQPVAVKIEAYDYTVYGDLAGKLTFISPDTLTEDLRQGEQPYYRVLARTDGRRFSGKPDEKLDIQPGMTATIEVKTGQRTVLQYLLKPVVKTMSQSLGER